MVLIVYYFSVHTLQKKIDAFYMDSCKILTESLRYKIATFIHLVYLHKEKKTCSINKRKSFLFMDTNTRTLVAFTYFILSDRKYCKIALFIVRVLIWTINKCKYTYLLFFSPTKWMVGGIARYKRKLSLSTTYIKKRAKLIANRYETWLVQPFVSTPQKK